MRAVAYAVGFVLLVSQAIGAPDFPQGAEALERQLLAKCDPYVAVWIKDQARATVSAGRISEGRARMLVQNAHLVPETQTDNISFLLLMQAARDADADLESVVHNSQQEWASQDELSNITHSRAPTPMQLSPGQQAQLQLRPKTGTVMKWHSTEAAAPDDKLPVADIDLTVHLDLQTAMDRESAAQQALAAAMSRLRQ
ncbi:MAG TPA: hypothetical protein VL286_06445 [Rhizomicrobium sp.]|jgi:hypothetical protein|nr:hypothetical protein [Rhizomicrobium sp.]